MKRLKLPSHLKHITTSTLFNSWTAQFYNTPWVVHLNEQSNNMNANVNYLGKYLKRPPIGGNPYQTLRWKNGYL